MSVVAEASRLVVLLLGCQGALAPLFERGLQGGTWDGQIHLYRLVDFDLTFRAGQFLPRIAPDLALDYGYPTFRFYSPLSVYLGETFRLFGLGYIASLKAGFAVAILLGAVGMYLLVRDLFGWPGAFAAALVYTYLPYQLVNVYSRGDLAETLGLGLLPFVFWSARRVTLGPTLARIGVAAVTAALLLLAHNLTAILAVPALLAFLAVSIRWPWRWKPIGGLVVTGLLSMALSAVYWLPVLRGLGELNLSVLTTGFFVGDTWLTPATQLVQRNWAYNYGYVLESDARYNLGLAQVAVAAVAAIWTIVARPRPRGVLWITIVVILSYVWLEQTTSYGVWSHFPIASFIQFPYRLIGIVDLGSAILVGTFFTTVKVKVVAPHWLPALVGPCLGLGAATLLVVTSLVALPRGHLSLQESEVNLPTMWRMELENNRIAGTSWDDYIPPWVQGNLFQLAARPASFGPVPVSVTATQISGDEVVLTTNAIKASDVIFDRLFDREWAASVDGQSIVPTPSGALGLLSVSVPAGTHRLRVWLRPTPDEFAGIVLSTVGGIVLLVLIARPDRPNWPIRAGLVALSLVIPAFWVSSQIRPPTPLAGSADFGSAIRLVGGRIDRTAVTPPGAIDVTLLWQALQSPLADCMVHLSLIDSTNHLVAQRDKAPTFGLRPCSVWQPGELVQDRQEIELPAEVPAGPYRLALSLTLGNQLITPLASDPSAASAENSPPGTVILGTVDAPTPPPTPTLAGATVSGAQIIDRDGPAGTIAFELVSARIISASAADPRFAARIRPGDALPVSLFWKSLHDVSVDYAVFVQLLDSQHRLVGQDDARPDHENFPTSLWFPGESMVDDHKIATQATLEPGNYTLAVGMYDRSSMQRLPIRAAGQGTDEIRLGTVKVARANQIFGATLATDPLTFRLGSQIELTGGRIDPISPRPGGSIGVNLKWLGVAQPSSNYIVFVHVLDQNGQLLAQHDGPPLNGSFQTSDWDPGDIVFDRVTLPLPATLAPGTYDVEVGLYQLDSGVRLSDPGGITSFRIGTFDVT